MKEFVITKIFHAVEFSIVDFDCMPGEVDRYIHVKGRHLAPHSYLMIGVRAHDRLWEV